MSIGWLDLVVGVGGLGVGAFGWTFAEYALHNWGGHKARGKNRFSREHLKHHKVKGYFSATVEKIGMACLAVALILPVAVWVAGWVAGVGFTAGFVGMYGVYEWVHRRLHTHAPRGVYGRWARKHHFYHHFGRATCNHGVTTPIWDVVFGTCHWPEQVRIPRRRAMAWMLDAGEGGELRGELQEDYVLVGRG